MAVTLLEEFIFLFQMACVVFLFAYLFSRSRFFKQVLEHRTTLLTQAFLTIVFGLLSIYGMSSGISFYTATVNIRDFGPLAAGLTCGPYVGLGAGIIGFLYRLSLGGTNVYAAALGPLAAGIVGGLVWYYQGRAPVPVKTAVIVTFLAESAISVLAILIRISAGEPYGTWMTVTVNVAVPMVVMTTVAVGVYMIILHNQIRDQRVQEEKLQLELEVESKRNLSTIINTIVFPVYVLDKEHRFTLVNDSVCRFIGKPCDEILGKTHRDFYKGIDAERHWDLVETAFRTHESREEEVTITRPSDGEQRTIISTSSMYSDASGEEFMVGVIEDITERKLMQTALQQNEAWYRILFEHTGAASIILNNDGTIDQANSEFIRLTGFAREEIEGKLSWKVLVHPDDLAMVKDYHFRRRQDPASVPGSYVVRMVDRNGTTRTLHAVVALIPGTKKSIASYIDITDQKKSEESLQQVNRKLHLLSSITRHDIINQLLILKGFLALLRKKTDDPALLDYVDRSERSTGNIEHHILFTRDYQDMGVKAPAWQNVKKSIIHAKGALSMGAVTVNANHESLEVYADPLFEKVFYNLIDNSLKYGGDKLTTITIDAYESENGLTIVYEDDGAGISDEDRVHIFERGFGKHSGFGLFLSREILSITGITIEENGTEGVGVRFEIKVPNGAWRVADATL